MRIAVDARPLLHPHTGIGRYTGTLIKELSRRGHEIIKCESAGSSVAQLVTSQFRFASEALKADADLFWSPRHHLPRNCKLPTVVTIHDLVWHKVPSSMTWGRRTVDKHLMLSSIKQADKIIVVSNSTKNDLCDVAPSVMQKVHVVLEAPTFPADLTTTPSQRSIREPYILFVGTVEPRKNLTTLVSAFLNSNTKHKLVIAGQDGWGNQDLPKSTRLLRVIPHSDEEVACLFQHAEFVVAPSLYEGFGLQIADALAFGKAIITSEVSSMPEVAGDAALYVNPTSVRDLSNAIDQLAADSVLRERLEMAARSRARTFSWEKACDETIEIMQEAIESKVGKART